MSDPRATGSARYAEDFELPGMLHARIVRSLFPHARVVRVDASAVPESCIVLTPDDVRDLSPYGCQIEDQNVLAERARHVGDPVAAVAAPTPEQAEEAVPLVEIDYEQLPAVFDAVEAARPGAPLLHETAAAGGAAAYFAMRPQPGTNICHRFRIRHGDVDAGFAEADALVASQTTCYADTGAYADCGPGVAQKMGFAAPGPYRIPNVRVDAYCVYTNLAPNGAFRGYGQMQSTWARERALDTLAEQLGLDPVELRLRNIARGGDVYCTGETLHDVRFAECLEAAAAAVRWSEGRRGKGIALVMKGMQTPSRAAIAIERDGDDYVLRCATTEMGQGAKRALSLEAARLLGVD